MSVQYFAAASQKSTRPAISSTLPALTVAVSVTTVPAFTVVTAASPAVIDKVVVVGSEAAREDGTISRKVIATVNATNTL